MKRVLTLLLENQFIKSSHSDDTYATTRGSAMGLKHSGALMDAVFYLIVEHDWMDSVDTREVFGFHKYFRYKDDIWLVVSDRLKFRNWMMAVKQQANNFFILEAIEASGTEVEFLVDESHDSKWHHLH